MTATPMTIDVAAPQIAGVKALVMAGGRAARMRKSSGAAHKALTPVLGISLLERNLRMLLRQGLPAITIAVSAREPALADACREIGGRCAEASGARVDIFIEEQPLGTIGAARAAGTDCAALLVVNVDNLTTLNLRRFIGWHRDQMAAMTIATHWEPFTIPYGEVVVQGDAVTASLEKPARPIRISSGTYVLSPEACGHIAPDRAVNVPDLFDLLTRRGATVSAFVHHAPWIDVNDAFDVSRAERLVREHAAEFGGTGQ